jgi:L-rhamnose mutarotase
VERVCFLARVRPERLDEYRDRHKAVWPEMLAALRAAGWGNYSVFLAADGPPDQSFLRLAEIFHLD